MGSGIAESAAAAGVDVTVYEPGQAPLERSQGRLAESVDRAVSRGKLTREDADTLTGRIAFTTSLNDLEGVDAVVPPFVGLVECDSGGLLAQEVSAPPLSDVESLLFPFDDAGLEVDLSGRAVMLLAAAGAEAAYPGGVVVLVAPVGQSILGVVKVALSGGDDLLGPCDLVADIGGSAVQL